MLNNKFYFLVLFILLSIFATPIYARSYSVSSVDINYTLNSDGLINVSEVWAYQLNGCYKELFIQKPNDLIISNPDGYCTGSTCEFLFKSEDTISGEQELILRGSYCDTSVIAYFNYDINNQIRVLVDGTQFYYQVYGDQTEVGTNVNINIFFPGPANKVAPLIHSQNASLNLVDNRISISKSVSSYEMIEVNILMPKNWFDINSPNFFAYSDYNYTIAQIKEIDSNWQEEYNSYNVEVYNTNTEPDSQDNNHSNENILKIILISILIICLFIILVWLIFGIEYSRSSVGYFGVFERDLPENEDPIKANYFVRGEFSEEWFSSAILYLVWKKNFDLIKKSEDEFILIKTKKEVDIKKTPKYVIDAYNFLIKHYPEKEINLEDLKNRISGRGVNLFSKGGISKIEQNLKVQSEFRKIYENTKKEYDSWFKKSKLFKGTGYNIFVIFFVILFFILFILTGLVFNGVYFFVFFILVFSLSFLSRLFFYKIIFGRFTKEGRLKNLKWEAFKRYITTFSLMKQHPPESVIIWEEYMVYATAMGVAKKTAKALQTILPEEFNHNNRFVAYSGFSSFSHSFSASTSRSTGGSFGGGHSGGFGGGGGGGGGGAR